MWHHIDLFSGIGGFAYAFREVFGNEGKTVLFCDNDPYCQAVLKRHWSDVPIWEDIRELIAHAKKCRFSSKRYTSRKKKKNTIFRKSNKYEITILTGGFPCQPFSQAGKRRGKGDDRYLWPEMLECIRLFRPLWVIAENVYGILNIEGGLVFEQVCSDMENEGYEVWPFIIPAVSVNAPHRRDRVWIVSRRTSLNTQPSRWSAGRNSKAGSEKVGWNSIDAFWKDRNTSHTISKGLEGKVNKKRQMSRFNKEDWQADWREIVFRTCIRGVDDGIPLWMDRVRISKSRHRKERLKMLGNAIVPQVVVEIMKAIKYTESRQQKV